MSVQWATTVDPPTLTVIVKIKQGDDSPLTFPVLVAGVPIDATGWTAKAQVRTRTGDLLHTWSTNNGSAVCDADGVSLLTDDSTDWEWKSGVFDVVAVSPEGLQLVPVEGTMRLQRLWTR